MPARLGAGKLTNSLKSKEATIERKEQSVSDPEVERRKFEKVIEKLSNSRLKLLQKFIDSMTGDDDAHAQADARDRRKGAAAYTRGEMEHIDAASGTSSITEKAVKKLR